MTSAGNQPSDAELRLQSEEMRKLIHELRVRQIELETQNEELRRAQAELATARARYFDLYDLAPVGYFTISEQGLILEANLTAANLLGEARSDLVEQPISRWIFAEDQDVFYLHRRQLLGLGSAQCCELRMLNKLGSIFWARLGSSVAPASDGERIFRVVARDITERKLAEEALQESERRFRTLAAAAPVGIFRVDPEGYGVYVNTRLCQIGGRPPEAFLGEGWMALLHEEDKAAVFEAFAEGMLRKASIKMDYRFRMPDGEVRWVTGQAEPELDEAGELMGYVGTIADITARKESEAKLRQAAIVFENTHEGVMITDAQSRIVRVNQAFTRLTGYQEHEVLGRDPSLLQSKRHPPEFYAAMWKSLFESGHWQGDIWNRRKDGEVFPELLSISAVLDDSGKTTHYVGIFADISKLKEIEARLEFQALHDPLTGLPNRALLFSRLEHALEVARRKESRLAMLMLDLDHFKDVNDTFGHLAGDQLLQEVSRRLLSHVRKVDTVCRLGGDEFSVLLEDVERAENAGKVAEALLQALSEPWRMDEERSVRVGVSIGISVFPEHGSTPEELLKHADAALYRAKSEGRGLFRYFKEGCPG